MPYTSHAARLFIHSFPQNFFARWRPAAVTGCSSIPSAVNSAAFASARFRKSARFKGISSSMHIRHFTSYFMKNKLRFIY